VSLEGYLFKSVLEKKDELNQVVKVSVSKLSQLIVEVVDENDTPLKGVNVFISSMNRDDQKR
jgi:hypothetical protein